MRDLKFRAWDKKKAKMHQGMLAGENKCFEIMGTPMEGGLGGDFVDYELMQFTGFKDTKSVEIFEGDIVNKEDILYQIQMKDGTWELTALPDDQYPGFDFPVAHWCERVAVVGNLHENPELIRKEAA
ncbi:MAG: hypothetical protein A3I61_11110 [Acidobacteria bacterium RIFCSPLOWO2_02_FULL_68_18]|nr:MAG: hypothetical protein A3I61_11110 [Acidobacteria bacterium RIFCSPLOWO2_02_FULL_68_18]OFW50619.1 MAG: hypothetical protein A3G77_16855 [Acidobacteria bacterium RIFCSPLOWO2_12_FULL_68_19]